MVGAGAVGAVICLPAAGRLVSRESAVQCRCTLHGAQSPSFRRSTMCRSGPVNGVPQTLGPTPHPPRPVTGGRRFDNAIMTSFLHKPVIPPVL